MVEQSAQIRKTVTRFGHLLMALFTGTMLDTLPTQASPSGPLSPIHTEKEADTSHVVICDGIHDETESLNALLRDGYSIRISNRGGACQIKHTLHISVNGTSIIGDGLASTTIEISSPSEPVIEVAAGLRNFSVRGVKITRTQEAASSSICGIVVGNDEIFADLDGIESTRSGNGFCLGSIAFGRLNNAISQENSGNGFYITNRNSTQPAQWTITNSLSQANDGYGFYVESGDHPLILLPWINDETFANGLGGVRMSGNSHGGYIVSATIEAGVFSSDGGDEIFFDTYSGYIKVGSGTFVEEAGQHATGRGFHLAPTHKGRGIVATTNVSDIHISDTLVSHSSESGIASGAYHTLISGATLYGNAIVNDGLCGYNGENGRIGTSTVISATRSGNLNANPLSGLQAGGFCFISGKGVSITASDVSFSRKSGIYFGRDPEQAKIADVVGYNTASSGVLQLSPGQKTTLVYHHLAGPPRAVTLTPATAIDGNWYVDQITSSSFRVNLTRPSKESIHMFWQSSFQ